MTTCQLHEPCANLMTRYEFILVLAKPSLSDDDCDALYEAGCHHGTVVTRDGVTYIAFDREAECLEDAIRSATDQVKAAGFQVGRVETDRLASGP